jgi:hypothetical protein
MHPFSCARVQHQRTTGEAGGEIRQGIVNRRFEVQHMTPQKTK